MDTLSPPFETIAGELGDLERNHRRHRISQLVRGSGLNPLTPSIATTSIRSLRIFGRPARLYWKTAFE